MTEELDRVAQIPARTLRPRSRLPRPQSHPASSNSETTRSSIEQPGALPDHTKISSPKHHSSRISQPIQRHDTLSPSDSSRAPFTTTKTSVTPGTPRIHSKLDAEANTSFLLQPQVEEPVNSPDQTIEDEIDRLTEELEAATQELNKACNAYLTALDRKRVC